MYDNINLIKNNLVDSIIKQILIEQTINILLKE